MLCHVTVSASSIDKDVFERRSQPEVRAKNAKSPLSVKLVPRVFWRFGLRGNAFKLGHIQAGICSITFLTRQGIKNKDLALCVESLIFPAL